MLYTHGAIQSFHHHRRRHKKNVAVQLYRMRLSHCMFFKIQGDVVVIMMYSTGERKSYYTLKSQKSIELLKLQLLVALQPGSVHIDRMSVRL